MPAHDPIALGLSLPLWSVLPFAGLLLAIALFPLVSPSIWVRHYGKVCLAFGLPVAGYFLLYDPGTLLHTALEYVSFLVLLASLFTISGGMLLRANAQRKRKVHVVLFFIFVVANIGGALTPIGDPPLFLGYLRGVPFFWTLRAMGLLWGVACALVIGIFYLVDRRALALEAVANDGPGTGSAAAGGGGGGVPLSIEGKVNLPLLGVVIGAVFLPTPFRETAMAAAAAVSAWKTPAKVREENEFTWHPIEEVAILFAGIFATMIPALLLLKVRGAELGVVSPAQFFWVTGALSTFLDNAPTYLTFFSLAQGVGGTQTVAGVSAPLLQAISAGAVFMGANSYIGNAPNFMVKAIAEEAGIRMPSFLGYMAWSCGILLPIFALLTFIFF